MDLEKQPGDPNAEVIQENCDLDGIRTPNLKSFVYCHPIWFEATVTDLDPVCIHPAPT